MAIHSVPCVPDISSFHIDIDLCNEDYFKIEKNTTAEYPQWPLRAAFRGRPWAGIELRLPLGVHGIYFANSLLATICEKRSSSRIAYVDEPASSIFYWEWDPIHTDPLKISDSLMRICKCMLFVEQLHDIIVSGVQK